MSALDALSSALAEFNGAVIVVSHNIAFLSSCCNELWEVERGVVRATRGEVGVVNEEAFLKLFAVYSKRVLAKGGTGGVDFGNDKKGGNVDSRMNKRDNKKKGKKGAGKGYAAKDRGVRRPSEAVRTPAGATTRHIRIGHALR